jgi:hypothetical protein
MPNPRRFLDAADGPDFHGVERLLHIGRLPHVADNNDGDSKPFQNLTRGLDAVHARHVQVHGDEFRLKLQGFSHRILAIHGKTHHVKSPVFFQDESQVLTARRGIVHNEHFLGSRHEMPRFQPVKRSSTSKRLLWSKELFTM